MSKEQKETVELMKRNGFVLAGGIVGNMVFMDKMTDVQTISIRITLDGKIIIAD